MSYAQLKTTCTPSDRTSPTSESSPMQKHAIVRKFRYRHDPYQLSTNAIVSCDESTHSSLGLDHSHTVSPQCGPMTTFQPCPPPCEMSLESHENWYNVPPPGCPQQLSPQCHQCENPPRSAHISQNSRSSDELYYSNGQSSSSSEEGLSSNYHEMMARLYDNSNSHAQAVPQKPPVLPRKNTNQRIHKKKANQYPQAAQTRERLVYSQDVYALVRFKYETTMYRCGFHVQSGDIVVVEADRGENTGTVEEVTNVIPNFNVTSRVIRLADADEARALRKQRNQVVVTQVVRKTAKTIDDLKINIVDTEMQADGKKLTVYYSADGYVDFRQLQRNLYRRFQCRIWLVNINAVAPMDATYTKNKYMQ